MLTAFRSPASPGTLAAAAVMLLIAGTLSAQEPQFGDDLVAAHLGPPGSDAATLIDLDGDGDLDLALARGNGDLRGAFVRFNDGAGVFTGGDGVPLPAPTFRAYTVVAVDFDGDGDPDLLFGADDPPLRGAQNRLFANDGNGNFTDATAATLPTMFDRTRALALVDVDGDADLDVVVGNARFSGAQNRLLVNDGRGRFVDETFTRLPLIAEYTSAIAVGDVDRDGDPDLVFTNGEWSPIPRPALRLLLNDGAGRFTDATGSLPPETAAAPGAEFADLDADGDLDLVVACTGAEFQARTQNLVYVNDGTGRFADESAARLPAPRDDTWVVAVADFDADGDPDLLFGNVPYQNGRDLDGRDTLYLNDGAGRFVDTSANLPALFDARRGIATGDVDGDGRIDIVAVNLGLSQLLLNVGAARFAAASGPAVRLAGAAASLESGDVNGDGVPDLAVGAYSWLAAPALIANDGYGRLAPMPGPAMANGRPFLGDVDDDGDLDIAVATVGQNQLFLNDRVHNAWIDVTATHVPTGEIRTRQISFADVDGDGDLDMVLANGGDVCCPVRDQLYRNDGTGRFTNVTPQQLPAPVERTRDLSVADADGDGDPDLLMANYERELRFFRNDGRGHFTDESASLPFGGWTARLVDVDGDGRADLVAGDPDRVSLALSDPSGGFRDVSATHLPPGPRDVSYLAVGDIDDDGDSDLVVQDGFGFIAFVNDGSGHFAEDAARIAGSAIAFTVGSTMPALHPVDLDGDGDLDLVRADRATGHPSAIAVHPNRHRHASHPRLARMGYAWDYEVWSRPGYSSLFDVAIPLLSPRGGDVPLPPFGTLRLDATAMIALDPLYVPPIVGRAMTTITVPVDPNLLGNDLFTQAAIVSPIGNARFTNATRVRVVR